MTMNEMEETELVDIELAHKEDEPDMKEVPEEMSTATTEEELSEEELKARRWNRNKKIFIGLMVVGFIIFVIVDSTSNQYLRSGIESFLRWVEDNAVAGMFAFMLVYFVATVLFVPGSILTLGAGFVFANAFGLGVGLLIGTLVVFIGASLGAVISFLLGRFLLRDWVKGLASKYAIFEALDTALESQGLRIMLLLRLSPIIPFNAINYIAGVTAISLFSYCMTLSGILPGTILYVFLGASAGSLADTSSSSGANMTVTIVVIVVGIVFGFFAVLLTSCYARKELNRIVAAREEQATQEDSEELQDIEAQDGGADGEAADLESVSQHMEMEA